jgi:hypothetical protein
VPIRGALCHPNATKWTLKLIRPMFDVSIKNCPSFGHDQQQRHLSTNDATWPWAPPQTTQCATPKAPMQFAAFRMSLLAVLISDGARVSSLPTRDRVRTNQLTTSFKGFVIGVQTTSLDLHPVRIAYFSSHVIPFRHCIPFGKVIVFHRLHQHGSCSLACYHGRPDQGSIPS